MFKLTKSMVNPFNPHTIPDELFTIFLSIIRRRGATMDEIELDTRLSRDQITQHLSHLQPTQHINRDLTSMKYYISQELWVYWVSEGITSKTPIGSRSIWLQNSAVKDWYPQSSTPRSTFVYYIGPYKHPYSLIYSDLIKPTVEHLGLICETASEDPGSEEFLKDKILPSLQNARYVLCDLSESNPNVHYELGWLHSFGTPFLAFTSKHRPSDVHHLTINSYKFDRDGLIGLQNHILQSLIKNEVTSKSTSLQIDWDELVAKLEM